MTIIKISAPRELQNCEAKTEFKGEKIFHKKSWDFNILLPKMDRKTTQKTNKNKEHKQYSKWRIPKQTYIEHSP